MASALIIDDPKLISISDNLFVSEDFSICEINELWAIRTLGLRYLEKHATLRIKQHAGRYIISGRKQLLLAINASPILSTLFSKALQVPPDELMDRLNKTED